MFPSASRWVAASAVCVATGFTTFMFVATPVLTAPAHEVPSARASASSCASFAASSSAGISSSCLKKMPCISGGNEKPCDTSASMPCDMSADALSVASICASVIL